MAGCGSNCSAGCCKDFSSRAERLPNLLSVEVTGEIFAKAVRNMTLRAAQRAAGMMSDEEYEEAKSKLVRWLVNAFSGENPHYEADSELPCCRTLQPAPGWTAAVCWVLRVRCQCCWAIISAPPSRQCWHP